MNTRQCCWESLGKPGKAWENLGKRRYRALDVSLPRLSGLQRGSLGLGRETLLGVGPSWEGPWKVPGLVSAVSHSKHQSDPSSIIQQRRRRWVVLGPVCSMLTNASRCHNMEISNIQVSTNFPTGRVRVLGLLIRVVRVSPNRRTIMVKQWSKTRRTTTSQLLKHCAETSMVAVAAKKSRSHNAGTGSQHSAQYRRRTHMMDPAAVKYHAETACIPSLVGCRVTNGLAHSYCSPHGESQAESDPCMRRLPCRLTCSLSTAHIGESLLLT